tara:strand:- start:889 stop:1503 length:615 start_codon:yes stop_codon:yes gene_type:complete
MKFLKEISNILSNPDDVRAQALTLDYYTNENHPEILDGGEEWVCHISKDVSRNESALGKATLEVITEIQKDIGLVTDYKTYCQYNTASSESPFVHTDQYLLLKDTSMKVDYIANVYITPDDVETESAWFEFYEAKDLDESAEMQDYLKLTSDKLTDIASKTFAYNKCLSFDSSIPHKNAPISTTPWGTDVTDSPLCFTVFMTTS